MNIKVLKQVNKLLVVIIIMTVVGPLTVGGVKFVADQNELKTGMTFQRKDLTDPIVDISDENLIEEESTDQEESVDQEATFLKKEVSTTAKSTRDAGVIAVENEEKSKVGAGEQVLEISTPTTLENELVTYDLTQEGELVQEEVNENKREVSEQGKEEVVNKIQVYNGKIISADKALATTVGGVDKVIYGYDTIEEAQSLEGGIPLSGGAYDAKYLGTETVGNQYFANVEIAGFNGYVNIDDIQIIPSSIVKSQSHYENINGDWTYFEATDPMQENSYLTYAIDYAPEWAQEGVAYYSSDDENFTTTNIDVSLTWDVVNPGNGGNNGNSGNGGNNGNGGGTSSSYFQNLPFTSSSKYTGSDYKSYLRHKGYTNSEYYNATNSFVEAQNQKRVNSLYLFAMANHESFFGTSEYARVCNNFFGWGAYDSNPDNACGNYGYNTARDGILAQGIHLSQQWGDLEDRRWAGTELGNKSHGVNVYYASDPDWGKKIAQHMFEIDKYLGGKENGYYKIYEIKSTQNVYTSYSSGTKLKIGKKGEEENYKLTREDGNPRVVVTGTNSKYFEFQLPTPRNNSSSETCKWTDANNGSFPNYGKTYSIKVERSTASFACDYDSWTKQQGWYPKETSSGNKTYKVISDSSAKNPSDSGGTSNSSHSLKTRLTSAYISNDKLHLEGVGYVKGISTKSTSDISHKIKFKQGNQILKSFKVSSKSNASYMKQFEKDGNQYDAGYFLANIPVSQIPSGTSSLYLGATAGGKYYEEKINTSKSTKVKFVGANKITVYKNGSNRLSVKKVPREGKIRTSSKKMWLKGTKLHIEGTGYMTEMYQKKTTDVQHTLQFVNTKTGKIVKSVNIGASSRPKMLNKFEKYGLQYDAGYFATYGYKGINISNIPVGTYKIYLKEKTGGKTAREWLNGAALPSSQANIKTKVNGKVYHVYRNTDKRMILKITKE